MLPKRFIITIALLLCRTFVTAQSESIIDLGKINGYDTVIKRLTYYTDYSNALSVDEAVTKPFRSFGDQFPFDPTKLDARHFIKLTVTNTGVPDTFWFYAGKAQRYSMYAYDSSTATLKLLNNQFKSFSNPVFNRVPFSLIVAPKGRQSIYYIEADINFYNWYLFDPAVLYPQENTSFVFEHLLAPHRLYSFTTIAFLGIMLSMLVYTFSIFLQSWKNEYLYYTLAMLAFFLYFFLRWLDQFMFSPQFHMFTNLKYQLLQLSGNIFVVAFIVAFFSLKKNSPSLFRHFKTLILAQVIFLSLNLPLSYSNKTLHWGLVAFDIFRALVLLYLVILIAVLIVRLKNYEATSLGIGTVVSILLSAVALYTYKKEDFEQSVLGNQGIPVLIFMLGILLQMVFYMRVLSHRERTLQMQRVRAMENLKLENDRKELEKFRAIIEARDKERNRIAQEMHDDIGSGLTSIRLLSEIGKAKDVHEASRNELEKISNTSNILIDKMNEIIWTLNSRNDTLPNLIAYLRHLIVEYFEPFRIHLDIVVPEDIKETPVDGKIRRNILLAVKEALHNIVKHSQATEVHIIFNADDTFSISISDNGVGFDPAHTISFKNGLHNIRERLSIIGGTCVISNNNGTSIALKIPLRRNPS
ncbi:MAG: hypothetical protein IT250_05960 [Chitinophagaceae bacterium]|nr:hypothetical protein [Chitinophagaceae bacterium]